VGVLVIPHFFKTKGIAQKTYTPLVLLVYVGVSERVGS